MTSSFAYNDAFSRNIGWLTPSEQAALATKRIAIAGMGGVGGSHLMTLVRLGIGDFHIADFDRFGIENFNRQFGANMATLGQPKVEVLARMAAQVNPDARIETFTDGVTAANVERFLSGADLYVDGLDFFAFGARQAVFAACSRLAIPAVTAAPLGMGAAVLTFMPGKTSFEGYFQWGDLPDEEKALRFLTGLAPAALHRTYLVDPSRVNMAEKRGPSTIIGCELCAGLAAAEALKILLKRGPVRAAPHGLHFDAYRNRFVRTWRPGGSRNPLQRLLRALARRKFGSPRASSAHG
jgi:molybdopterin/thiamine biosynthesis adenylyltransferase